MINKFWQPDNKEIVIIALIVVVSVAILNGYSSHISVNLPNGLTFDSDHKPPKR
jgi:uncharacterized membrane protein